jgi:hypothetical protein
MLSLEDCSMFLKESIKFDDPRFNELFQKMNLPLEKILVYTASDLLLCRLMI